MFYNIAKIVVKFLLLIFFRIEVRGIDNIPESGAFIICPNHISYLDPPLVACFIKRRIYYMAKEELFHNRLVGKILKMLGAFPVKRGTADFMAIKTALKVLKEGKTLGLFVEGTRSRNRELKKAEPGVALLSIKASCPIVPVAIVGEYKLFNKIIINIGSPFYLKVNSNNKNDSEYLSEISQIVIEKIRALQEEANENNSS